MDISVDELIDNGKNLNVWKVWMFEEWYAERELIVIMLSNCKTVTEWSAMFGKLWMIGHLFASVKHEE